MTMIVPSVHLADWPVNNEKYIDKSLTISGKGLSRSGRMLQESWKE
jgi:hypothetical protein